MTLVLCLLISCVAYELMGNGAALLALCKFHGTANSRLLTSNPLNESQCTTEAFALLTYHALNERQYTTEALALLTYNALNESQYTTEYITEALPLLPTMPPLLLCSFSFLGGAGKRSLLAT